MILGESIMLGEGRALTFTLPAGHGLSEDNLRQLAVRRAEIVCIALPDTRSEEEVTAELAAATARVMEIFEGADLRQPAVAALFKCIQAYRSR